MLYISVEYKSNAGLLLKGSVYTCSINIATGKAKLIIGNPKRTATPIAIGINIIDLMVFDCINKALKTIIPVRTTYNNQKGVSAPKPIASKAAFTEI